MAGDWIKMEINLRDKPEVIAVATKLALHRDLVVGKLFLLWCWFDQHTNDGHARGVTPAFVDELVAVEGFALALASESWLIIRNGAIVMPNFDRHLSKSAKNRALGKERVQRFRNDASVTSPLPEKRREEKRRESASADSPYKSPTGDERKEARGRGSGQKSSSDGAPRDARTTRKPLVL